MRYRRRCAISNRNLIRTPSRDVSPMRFASIPWAAVQITWTEFAPDSPPEGTGFELRVRGRGELGLHPAAWLGLGLGRAQSHGQVGNQWKTRRQGEPLHPDREPLDTLDRIRRTIGEYNFAGQYQQSPAPLGGGLVKAEWFKRYRENERLDLGNQLDAVVERSRRAPVVRMEIPTERRG